MVLTSRRVLLVLVLTLHAVVVWGAYHAGYPFAAGVGAGVMLGALVALFIMALELAGDPRKLADVSRWQ